MDGVTKLRTGGGGGGGVKILKKMCTYFIDGLYYQAIASVVPAHYHIMNSLNQNFSYKLKACMQQDFRRTVTEDS